MGTPELLAYMAGLLACLGGSWLFSGAETGIYTTNRLRLRYRLDQGLPSAKALTALLARPRQTISTTLIGNNLCVYGATVCCSLIILGWFGTDEHTTELITVLFLTPILFLFGEIHPKSVFQARADVLMPRIARPLRWLRRVFMPATVLLLGIVKLFEKMAGLSEDAPTAPFSRANLHHFIQEGALAGALSAEQEAMTANILHLRDRTIAGAMVGIDQAIMVRRGDSAATLQANLASRYHARLPVYSGAKHHVVGMLDIFDIDDWNAPDVTVYRVPPAYLPQSMAIDDAITLLRRTHTSLAIVIDTHGHALGIVTVKDLVGEIVGEMGQ